MRKVVRAVCIWIALIPCWLLAVPAPVRAAADCNGTISSPRLLTIECRPGYATASDRVLIYSQRDFDPAQVWTAQLDDSSATWIFDASADDTANLIIIFERQGQQHSARLFDDQDGDGRVLYRQEAGRIDVIEGMGKPTVTVTAQDGWRQRDGTLNFNLDLTIDGPVAGMIDARTLYLDKVKTDGKADLLAHVRDLDRDGRPDYEWRQAYPPMHEEEGFYHSSVMVNTVDDEPPITDAHFWPFLGSGAHNFIKEDYASTSHAPINIDWSRSQITQLVESVASRNRPHNYFIYSINRIKEGQVNDVNFESPFAFYQFSPVQSNYPDVALRVAYYPKGNASAHLPVEEIDLSWRQSPHNPDTLPSWDYRVGMTGHNAHQGEVSLPDFSLRITPYEALPRWVSSNSWDYATFVARERDTYLSSEGIYEWSTLEGAIVDANNQEKYTDLLLASRTAGEDYVLGGADEVPDQYYHTIRPGLRGEFRSRSGRPHLYFSPIDRKLHMLGADHGVWQIDERTTLRYANLDHDSYLDQWVYTAITTGTTTLTTTRQLNVAPGYLLYADDSTITIRETQPQPSLFETLPPADQAEWQTLGASLETHQRSFAPDDLQGLMRQFAGPEMRLTGASLRDFRIVGKQGFRFVLMVQPGFDVQGSAPLALENVQPGAYAVTYDGTFRVEPLTPPAPTAMLHTTTLQELEPSTIDLTLQNTGLQDLPPAMLELWAAPPDAEATIVASDTVSLLAQSPISVTLDWTPPSAGTWTITPKLRQAQHTITLDSARLSIRSTQSITAGLLIAASASFKTLPLILVTLIAFATLAASIWRQQWCLSEIENREQRTENNRTTEPRT